ncbi:MAG: GreA/GreB family elongation factor, partial [Myxococcota bacterium]
PLRAPSTPFLPRSGVGQRSSRRFRLRLHTSLPNFGPTSTIALGAIIEAMCEDEDGTFSKTFVLLPAGAGTELTGPGGDGVISVITPASPVGKAMMGKRAGDVAEVVVKGEPLDWEILEVWS